MLPVCASNEYDSWHIAQYCEVEARAAVELELVVAGVAGVVVHDLAAGGDGPPDAGMKVKAALFAGDDSVVPAGRRRISRPTRCTSEGS